jgi:phage-related minor tail protein
LDTLWKILNNDESVDLAKIVTIFDNIAVAVDKAGNKIENAKDKTGTLRAAMAACGMSTKEIEAAMDEYNATLAQYEDKVEGAEAALKKVIAAMQNHNAEMDKTKTKSISYAEAFSIAASAVMTLT